MIRTERIGNNFFIPAMQQVTISDSNINISSFRALRRIIRALDVHSRQLYRKWNITSPQMLALHMLASGSPFTLSSLAENLNLSMSTMNGIVDRLESRALVRRTRSTLDQRKVNLDITDAGKALLDSVPELMRDLYSQAFNRFSQHEQVLLGELLIKLADTIASAAPEMAANPKTMPAYDDLISSTAKDFTLH
jgi:DNA-binding MarR family transcriptional regulator